MTLHGVVVTECPRGFVAEFNPNVSGTQSLAAVSYFGGITPIPSVGAVGTQGNAIAVDQGGDIFVTGIATTTDFPETGQTPTSAGAAQIYQPYQPLPNQGSLPCTTPCQSGYLVEFSPGATNIWYSTYLGAGNGIVTDYVTGIALDSKSNVYLVGNESSSTVTIPPLGGTPPLIATPPSAESGFFSVLNISQNQNPPLIGFSPSIANFGNVSSGQIPLTVQNVGTGTLEIQNVSVNLTSPSGPSNPFSEVLASCTGGGSPSVMLPGSSCAFTLSFNPTARQPYRGTITFADNAPQGAPDTTLGLGWYDQTYVLEGNSTGFGATLTSIAVSPLNPGISVGGTEQFTANGTFSDGSTWDNIQGVAWSVNPSSTAATINPTGGLATGQNVGTATIQASESGVFGTTVLTVTQATTTRLTSPLNNTSVPSGTAVTLTANVTRLPNTPVSGLTVTFYDYAVLGAPANLGIGTPTTDAFGNTSLTISTLGVGTHLLVAVAVSMGRRNTSSKFTCRSLPG